MKSAAIGILLLLGVAFAAFEWRFPPVSETYWSPEWGGSLQTYDARRGLERRPWQFPDLKTNSRLLFYECLLIAGALGLGFSALQSGKGKAQASDRAVASRMMARCALVMHCGVLLLPLARAGSDTLWAIRYPALGLLLGLVLWPNFMVWRFSLRLSGFARQATPSPSPPRWHFWFTATTALAWTVLLCLGLFGPHDVGDPMGGSFLGCAALWLTLLAQIFGQRPGGT